MIRSLIRLRLGQWHKLAPLTALVIVVPAHPDPVGKRATGYAGVLPIPATAASTARLLRLDSLLEVHRDARAERGRVLYSPGHGPRDTAATVIRAARHHQCPTQRVGQAPRPSNAPTS